MRALVCRTRYIRAHPWKKHSRPTPVAGRFYDYFYDYVRGYKDPSRLSYKSLLLVIRYNYISLRPLEQLGEYISKPLFLAFD